MVVAKKHLLGKSWLTVYILTTSTGSIIKLDLREKKLSDDPGSIFSATNKVFALDIDRDLSEDDRAPAQTASRSG